MNGELKQIIEELKERTGIIVSAYSESEKTVAVALNGYDFTMPSKSDFSEIFVENKTKNTYFKFRFRGEDYIGQIEGSGETQTNYAFFILTYFENFGLKDINYSKNDFFKNLLLGNCTKAQIQKFASKNSKFDYLERRLYVVCFSVDQTNVSYLFNFLENLNPNSMDIVVSMTENICAYVKFIDETVEEQSQGSSINAILQAYKEETGVDAKVGIGTNVEGIYSVNVSFVQAKEALGYAEYFNSKLNVHSYREYVWVKMFNEMPKNRIMDYLAVLEDKSAKAIFDDSDMLSTAEEFLENDLNISETARKLFMHRNTLMYRLDKIEKATGLNVKVFADAVTFRLITILNKIINT